MRIKRPDKKNALSIVLSAESDMKFTLTLPVNESSSSTIVRNIYESFRKLGDALLINHGFFSENHIEPINELLKLNVKTSRPINLLDNLRRLRHNINYYGYKPNELEVFDVINLAKDLFEPLLLVVKDKISI
ncbi:hypothetical protein JXM83_07335 [Candidatus Woesearchaeota archaeon]|nr:hypothetical protein [Candidatus Woesearchaeota archaeon]